LMFTFSSISYCKEFMRLMDSWKKRGKGMKGIMILLSRSRNKIFKTTENDDVIDPLSDEKSKSEGD
jgi:hypothetical protein